MDRTRASPSAGCEWDAGDAGLFPTAPEQLFSFQCLGVVYMLPADEQVDTGDGQDDGEQQDRRRRCVGGITAAVAVQHVVDITHNGIHFRRIQVCAEQCHRVAVCLKGADESRDDQVEDGGRDHRQGDLSENTEPGGAVHSGGVIIYLIDGSQGAGQDQDLKRHDHPDRVEAQDKHFRPVGTVNEVHGTASEPVDQQIDQAVRVGCLLEQDHKYQSHSQSVGDIGQEVDRLEQFLQWPDGAQRQRDQQRQPCGKGHRNDHQYKSIFHRL